MVATAAEVRMAADPAMVVVRGMAEAMAAGTEATVAGPGHGVGMATGTVGKVVAAVPDLVQVPLPREALRERPMLATAEAETAPASATGSPCPGCWQTGMARRAV